MKDLVVRVKEIRERCGANLKSGDLFYIKGYGKIEIPEGKFACIYALNALMPFLTAKQREEELPQDDWIAETKELCCPDPKGVKFEIETL
ncbi:MAG: TIGR04076 family protein [Candidatus Aminicenantia bacterium]